MFTITSLISDDGEVCIGGYARIIATVKRLKEEKAALNPMYLNAGDNFQGTLWYTLLRWNVTRYMLNLVPADAMVRNYLKKSGLFFLIQFFQNQTIGNHDFDNGVAGLAPFLDTIESTIVIANLDVSQEPTLVGKFQKSKVIMRGERKIGIIGVIIKSTPVSCLEKIKTVNLLFTKYLL
jgi:5'-nucleotidase